MQNIEKERYSWLKLSIILLLIFGLGAATALTSGEDLQINLDDQQSLSIMKLAQAFLVIVIFIIPAVLFAAFCTKEGVPYLGVMTKPAWSTTILASTGMILALPLINGLAEVNQHLQLPAFLHDFEGWMQRSEEKGKIITEAFLQGTDVSTLLLNLFVIAFMAALSEELFFRGVLQKVLIECSNKHVGVWVGAILFSAFHMQFYGFLPRMLMGAYLGYLFLWSGSLWPGIIAHFMNNGLAVYVTWLINRGTIGRDIDKVGVNEQEWIYVVLSVIIVITSLIMVHRIEKKRQRDLFELKDAR